MPHHPLATPRWLLAHVLVVVATVVFVLLGLWQLDRWGEERAYAAALEERLHVEPVSLAELADRPIDDIEHLPVVAQGTFITDEEVLLRSRSHDGRSGYHVVTPLELDDGRAVLVNRGWVPFELDDPPVSQAAPPAHVQVTGIVLSSTTQPTGGLAPRDPDEGELERLFHADVDRIASQVDVTLLPFLVQLTGQQPQQDGSLPIPAALPEADPTQNLSYAIQWFSFAAIAVIGYAIGMRHLTGRRRREDTNVGGGGATKDIHEVAP